MIKNFNNFIVENKMWGKTNSLYTKCCMTLIDL